MNSPRRPDWYMVLHAIVVLFIGVTIILVMLTLATGWPG